MRILFFSHVPLEEPERGAGTLTVAVGLQAAGHSIRALVVDHKSRDESRVPLRRVMCRPGDPLAELEFEMPRFVAVHGSQRFLDLSDAEIGAYRQALRRALDAEIATFDPQIIHAEHAWLTAHLALESGVPYVLTAHEEELLQYRQDARYQRLASEAAENAGRVIASDEKIAEQLTSIFGDLDGRIEIAPWIAGYREGADAKTCAAALTSIYGQVLDERLGRRWRP